MRSALSWISRYRNRIFYVLTISFLTSVIATQVTVLCPPKVVAATSSEKTSLDGSFSINVWGLVDKKTLTVETTPNVPVKTVWKNSFVPLMQRLVIEPQGLLKPDATYFIRVNIKNWYGATSSSQLVENTESAPKIISVDPLPNKKDVPPDTEIGFTTDKAFTSGDYEFLAAPDFKHEIRVEDSKILVKPASRLTGGQTYKIYLFLKLTGTDLVLLYSSEFAVVSPLQLVAASPANGDQTVLKQSAFSFSFNKAVDKKTWPASFSIEPETSGNFAWPDEKTVVFTPSAPLKTNTSYSIKISAATLAGTDGSRLDQDLITNFKTAGPVKVISFSPTGNAASLSSTIRATFDQPVDQPSAQERFSLSPAVPGSFSWEGNTLIFHPSALSLSATYRVSVAAGIKSIGGEDSTESFSNTFTTTSERTRVIGYSVRGRPITATYFGIGSKKILLVAAMHGSETNTGAMLSQWITYLRGNQSLIGADRTFIIVPYANPDGRATNQRFNAHGVDLNRNWGTSDWQSLTYLNNTSYPTGGGPYPFSEPETVALRNLITSESPAAIITYHSAANLILGDGIAQSLGDWYAAQTGYNRSGSGPDDPGSCTSALGYCITGSMEEWASDRGFVTIVVEFASGSSSEYDRNFPALKGLLTLPI